MGYANAVKAPSRLLTTGTQNMIVRKFLLTQTKKSINLENLVADRLMNLGNISLEYVMTPAKKQESTVRLQVPVSPELAEEIKKFAESLNMTPRRMAGELLDATAEGRQTVMDRITSDVLAAMTEAVRVLSGKGRVRSANKSEPIHLDVQVKAETAQFIAALGEKLGHPPGRMAGQVLRWGVLENDWAISLIAAPAVAVYEKLKSVRETVQPRGVKGRSKHAGTDRDST